MKKQSKPTRRCHWVPQTYLNRFSVPGSEPPKIWSYAKDAKDPILKRVEKVAVKFHLYVPRDEKGNRDDSFEKRLADLEEWFVHPIWNVLASKEVDLSWDPLRKMVSLTVATMYLRSPNTYEKFIEIHNHMRDTIISNGGVIPNEATIRDKTFSLNQSSWPAFRDADENDIKKNWLSEVGNATALAKDLMKMRWSILCLEDPLFATSDNPVTVIHPSLKFKGFQNPGSSVLFPLSPTRLLTLDHLYEEPANQYYHCDHEGSVQNLLLWRGAIQRIFSPNEPEIVLNNILINEKFK